MEEELKHLINTFSIYFSDSIKTSENTSEYITSIIRKVKNKVELNDKSLSKDFDKENIVIKNLNYVSKNDVINHNFDLLKNYFKMDIDTLNKSNKDEPSKNIDSKDVLNNKIVNTSKTSNKAFLKTYFKKKLKNIITEVFELRLINDIFDLSRKEKDTSQSIYSMVVSKSITFLITLMEDFTDISVLQNNNNKSDGINCNKNNTHSFSIDNELSYDLDFISNTKIYYSLLNLLYDSNKKKQTENINNCDNSKNNNKTKNNLTDVPYLSSFLRLIKDSSKSNIIYLENYINSNIRYNNKSNNNPNNIGNTDNTDNTKENILYKKLLKISDSLNNSINCIDEATCNIETSSINIDNNSIYKINEINNTKYLNVNDNKDVNIKHNKECKDLIGVSNNSLNEQFNYSNEVSNISLMDNHNNSVDNNIISISDNTNEDINIKNEYLIESVFSFQAKYIDIISANPYLNPFLRIVNKNNESNCKSNNKSSNITNSNTNDNTKNIYFTNNNTINIETTTKSNNINKIINNINPKYKIKFPKLSYRNDCLRKKVKTIFFDYLFNNLNDYVNKYYSKDVNFLRLPKIIVTDLNFNENNKLLTMTIKELFSYIKKNTINTKNSDSNTCLIKAQKDRVDYNVSILNLLLNSYTNTIDSSSIGNELILEKTIKFLNKKVYVCFIEFLCSDDYYEKLIFYNKKESKLYVRRLNRTALEFLIYYKVKLSGENFNEIIVYKENKEIKDNKVNKINKVEKQSKRNEKYNKTYCLNNKLYNRSLNNDDNSINNEFGIDNNENNKHLIEQILNFSLKYSVFSVFNNVINWKISKRVEELLDSKADDDSNNENIENFGDNKNHINNNNILIADSIDTINFDNSLTINNNNNNSINNINLNTINKTTYITNNSNNIDRSNKNNISQRLINASEDYNNDINNEPDFISTNPDAQNNININIINNNIIETHSINNSEAHFINNNIMNKSNNNLSLREDFNN